VLIYIVLIPALQEMGVARSERSLRRSGQITSPKYPNAEGQLTISFVRHYLRKMKGHDPCMLEKTPKT
jgi:hypothetical protein